MSKYKLIYSFSEHLEREREYCKEEGLDEEEIEPYLKEITPRYAWYEEGQIYDENYSSDGNAWPVNIMVKIYPEDWEKVEE